MHIFSSQYGDLQEEKFFHIWVADNERIYISGYWGKDNIFANVPLEYEHPEDDTQLQIDVSAITKQGSCYGLLYSDGKLVVNFSEKTSLTVLKDIARLSKAELVRVTGTWTFIPDAIQKFGKL